MSVCLSVCLFPTVSVVICLTWNKRIDWSINLLCCSIVYSAVASWSLEPLMIHHLIIIGWCRSLVQCSQLSSSKTLRRWLTWPMTHSMDWRLQCSPRTWILPSGLPTVWKLALSGEWIHYDWATWILCSLRSIFPLWLKSFDCFLAKLWHGIMYMVGHKLCFMREWEGHQFATRFLFFLFRCWQLYDWCHFQWPYLTRVSRS